MAETAYVGIDGVAREIEKGYVGVNMLQTVGALPVGTVVKIKVNGKNTDFIVVHQGNPDATIYDSSCDGTWLLMKGGYVHQQWATTLRDGYDASYLHSYLNNDFLALLSSAVQGCIKQVKIPYVDINNSEFIDKYGANGLPAKVFSLSCAEMGTKSNVSVVKNGEGALLDYFLEGTGDEATALRYAEWSMGSGAIDYWLRSVASVTRAHYIQNYNVTLVGKANSTDATNSNVVRPAMVLDSNTGVNNAIIDGSAATYAQVAKRIVKAYVGVNGVAKLVWKGMIE